MGKQQPKKPEAKRIVVNRDRLTNHRAEYQKSKATFTCIAIIYVCCIVFMAVALGALAWNWTVLEDISGKRVTAIRTLKNLTNEVKDQYNQIIDQLNKNRHAMLQVKMKAANRSLNPPLTRRNVEL